MLKKIVQVISQLIFPEICFSCGKILVKGEELICLECTYHLPKTNYYQEIENPVHQIFWGRIEIKKATALYFFEKGGLLQKLIHQLKYEGKKEIGYALGKNMGIHLKKADFTSDIDLIIPIPIHDKRRHERGYNQSEWIGKGLCEISGIEIDTTSVIRIKETKTQTKKTRDERWENVQSIFKVTDPKKLNNKHILIIDDILTTGATIEACAAEIKSQTQALISIATIGLSK